MRKESAKDKAVKLQETVSTDGWNIVDEWIKQVEENMVVALKQFYTVKSEEQAKWINFYAGQAEVINTFKQFIDSTLNRPFNKKEIKKPL